MAAAADMTPLAHALMAHEGGNVPSWLVSAMTWVSLSLAAFTLIGTPRRRARRARRGTQQGIGGASCRSALAAPPAGRAADSSALAAEPCVGVSPCRDEPRFPMETKRAEIPSSVLDDLCRYGPARSTPRLPLRSRRTARRLLWGPSRRPVLAPGVVAIVLGARGSARLSGPGQDSTGHLGGNGTTTGNDPFCGGRSVCRLAPGFCVAPRPGGEVPQRELPQGWAGGNRGRGRWAPFVGFSSCNLALFARGHKTALAVLAGVRRAACLRSVWPVQWHSDVEIMGRTFGFISERCGTSCWRTPVRWKSQESTTSAKSLLFTSPSQWNVQPFSDQIHFFHRVTGHGHSFPRGWEDFSVPFDLNWWSSVDF